MGRDGRDSGANIPESLKILYTNAQSLPNKVNELCGIAADLKPDLILITETWCNPSIDNSLLKIPDYDVHTDLRRDREDTQHGIGGGLLVYVGPGISIINRDDAESDSRFNQYCSFDVVGLEEKWTIYLVYRPPGSTGENNLSLAELVISCEHNSILVGDFNYPGINWSDQTADSKGKVFLDACTIRGLEQLVSTPTHIKGNTLDLVLTDKPDKLVTVESVGRLGRSDHEMLLLDLDVRGRSSTEKKLTKNWRRADWEAMRQKLAEKDWSTSLQSQDTEAAWRTFKDAVDNLVEEFVPTREYRSADRPPWMSTELIQEIRQKRRLWKKFKNSPSERNREEYKTAEKSVYKKIRNAKKKHEKGLANERGKEKQFFAYMKDKTGVRAAVGPLKQDGVTVPDSEGMAKVLNDYSGTVFKKENVDEVPGAPELKVKSKCRGVNFRVSAVKNAIRKLKTKSAPGPDGITPKFLQELVDEVAVPLGAIFTKSMAEGVIPEDWRKAHVCPIFKKGQKSDPANYRPVSLTSVPGKVMERVIKETMMSHLSRNQLIKTSQHGFMPKKSCTTNLLEYLEMLTKAVDSGEKVDVVYLDFAKAFDLVPRLRLVAKLKAHGFSGELLQWISTWLKGRSQRVVINGKLSDWIAVTSGVPQGSILGPILFAIFINDIDDGIANIVDILLKFADDTKVGKVIRGEADRIRLQEALNKLCSWADKWEMRFNVNKCHVMHLGRNNERHNYTMYGNILEKTDKEKDIGVIVNSNLKPTDQCEKAARTATGVLHRILRAFTYRDRTVLPRIYKQYVRPHLEFAVQAWAPWQRGEIDLLESVQKKMVKEVTGLKGVSYEDRLTELGMESLEKRRQGQDLMQAFKILKEVDNVDKTTWFHQALPRSHQTRATEGGHHIVLENARLELRRNFFSQRVAEKWNSLPGETKEARTVKEFKNCLMRKA